MSDKEAVKKLLGLLNSYKSAIIAIIGCLLISTGLNLCIPLISSRIMDDGFIGGNKDLLIKLVLCTLTIYIISSVIDVIKEAKRIDISKKLHFSLSEQSFLHLMRMSVSFFGDKNNAEILNNINIDINNMSSIADESMFFVITQVFSIAGGIIGLFILDLRMTLLVLLFIPIKYGIMKRFAETRKKFMDALINESQQYARWFGDTVGGVREIKLFGILDHKHEEFSEKQMRVLDIQKRMNMLSQWNSVADTALINILTTALYIIGANLVFSMQLSVGNIFAFITYSAYVTGPISAILNIGYFVSGVIPSTKRYYEFMALDEEPYYEDTADIAEPLKNGDIEFRNVTFSYDNKIVLKNICFRILKGSKTAFIGKNGSGKSTIIDLFLRMYTPVDGTILLADRDIGSLPLVKFREMISVVSQDIYLFNDTIRNNISMYKDADDKEIIDVCKESGLSEFVSEVTLDYIVGQNGALLSGGQKQKIALARALFHDRPIVVFDEATSSSDNYTEKQINNLLHTKLNEKTVIVVTHRTGILENVDQVIRLDDGRAFIER